MKERIVFLIFIILVLCSFAGYEIYESTLTEKIGQKEYVTMEGVLYRDVWNSEKSFILDTKEVFGRILVKSMNNGEAFLGEKIKITGYVTYPETERNPEGFNQAAFLAGKNIYRILETDSVAKQEGFAFDIRAFGSRLRQGLEKSVTELMGSNSGFMLGVMTGDTSALDKDTKSYVRLSGISHLFAVSGMHVGYVLMPFQKGVKRKGLGIAARSVICILPLVFFAVLTGLSPSVIRAVTGTCYGLIAKAVKRKPDFLNGIGLGGIICLLLYPFAVADTGFILSFGAVLSAAFILPILKKAKKKKNKLFDLVSYGLAVNIGLLPVMIYKYGTFSFVGIVITVIAAPLSAVLCVLGYLSAALYMIPFTRYISKIISYGLLTITKLIEKTAETGSFIPNIRLPTYAAFLIAAAYLIFIALYFKKTKGLMILCGFLCCISVSAFVSSVLNKYQEKIIWLDVGQGSCAFVQTGGGKRLLFDGGPGLTDVAEILLKMGYMKIDCVIASHGDKDHAEGLFEVLRKCSVDMLLVPDNPDDENIALLTETANEENIKVTTVGGPCRLKTDDQNELLIYFYRDSASLNNSSLVVQLKTINGSVLFPGDIEINGEKLLEKSGVIGECEIVTASHHGSKGATGEALLKLTKPKLSVISVGKKNFYGHPNKETIERLEKAGIYILRTDREGAITAYLSEEYIGATTWLTQRKLIIR